MERGGLYDVSSYTDQELFDILELDNPGDRVLEAKLLSMVRKYDSMEGEDAEQLMHFFIDIYSRFFDTVPEEFESSDDEADTEKEGFVGYGIRNDPNSNVGVYTTGGYLDDPTMSDAQAKDPNRNRSMNIQMAQQGDRFTGGYGGRGYTSGGTTTEYTSPITMSETYDRRIDAIGNNKTYSNFVGDTLLYDEKGDNLENISGPKITQTFGANKIVNRGTLKTTDELGKPLDNTQLTKQIDYSKDVLNPLLKQTIKRVISIDSQYRENKQSSSTEFTFNLSEPLKDVVSLKLYSIQIPYTWYTINGSFGGNFFYIKGHSPGIDNGDHDYKIQIPSGNYTGSSLVADIHNSINTLKATQLDISFGTTDITYNPATVRSTITMDIKEVFGESNYYLEFPPVSTMDTRRNRTLTGFLGYNNMRYDVCSVYSEYISNDTRVSLAAATIELKTYTVGNTLNENYITRGETFLEHHAEHIDVPAQANAPIRDVVSAMHTALGTLPGVDTAHSFVHFVDSGLSDGRSRIQMNIKWKRAFIQSIENIKTVVIFPVEYTAKLHFSATIETSHIISNNPMLKSDYRIDNSGSTTNTLQLQCIHAGYTEGFDHNIVLPASSATGYKLEQYIDAINTAIQGQNRNGRLAGTRMYSVSDTSFVKMEISVDQTFTGEDYNIIFDGSNIAEFFGQVPGQEVPLGNTVFTSSSYTKTTLAINEEGTYPKETIRIRPRTNTSQEFVIEINTIVASNLEDILKIIEPNIVDYRVLNEPVEYNQFPFKYSIMSSGSSTDLSTFQMQIRVQQKLVTKDFKLNFLSTQLPTNTWNAYLKFNATYDLSNNINEQSVATIQNNEPVYDNQLVIDASNRYVWLKSFSDTNGLTSNGSGLYDIKIDILPTIRTATNKYSANEIYSAINAQLASNPLTAGSSLYTTGTEYSGNAVFRININKVFRTPDYRLVFYDPYSFVSCYSGASRSGNKSVQNATWDTTVGWILGFRESIIYYLTDYTEASSTDSIYFNADKTICTLIGDTTVSTSLYNYFLIALDDYTQNHLNDGLVTITTQETAINVGPYKYVCNPYNTTGSSMIAVPIREGITTDNGQITGITQKELYTFNEKLLSKQVKEKSYSKGPFVKDIFGIIPIKTAGLVTGATYVEFGGTLQNQERMYFGPVNIHRMTIRLLNDRGDMVDLNNANWSFSLVCEQLYRS